MEPPYQRLANELRQRIATGEWGSGTQIPSSRELQHRYGLGRGAVERALAVLRADRTLEGRPGARLFVAEPPAVRTLVNADAQWPHGTGDGESGTCRATGDLRWRLQTPERAKLYWERTELLDPGGRPAMLVTSWTRSTRHRPHAMVRCELRPHALTVVEARALGLVQGVPAFLVERTRCDAEGRPVQAADLVLPADRWRVGFRLARGQ